MFPICLLNLPSMRQFVFNLCPQIVSTGPNLSLICLLHLSPHGENLAKFVSPFTFSGTNLSLICLPNLSPRRQICLKFVSPICLPRDKFVSVPLGDKLERQIFGGGTPGRQIAYTNQSFWGGSLCTSNQVWAEKHYAVICE